MVGINTPYSGDPADFCASDDAMTLGLQACTHWDALAHVSYEGKLYNGFHASTITAERGAARCGIHRISHVVSRAILLDVARATGHDPVLPPRHLDQRGRPRGRRRRWRGCDPSPATSCSCAPGR